MNTSPEEMQRKMKIAFIINTAWYLLQPDAVVLES